MRRVDVRVTQTRGLDFDTRLPGSELTSGWLFERNYPIEAVRVSLVVLAHRAALPPPVAEVPDISD
jgi:hypothetical protein